MFCVECICNRCPHGLKCWICHNELNGHLLINEGCSGNYVANTCLLEEIAPEHADALRKIIKARDRDAMEAYFDRETGVWHNTSKSDFRR